uniref:Probable helicase DDB_G0274399 n=1 Tax=Dermatophagoides pteronyssinus TaxID=6956 RepID=A0A6P6YC24_DERPT|nr:probable helicase DDB_G0274399 [Dermatophagoides pteronyssinus]
MNWLANALVNPGLVTWTMTKVLNMSTLFRERFIIPPALLKIFETKFNDSQLEAIKECTKYEGVSLIQGPPGTGKTSTISAITSLLLSAEDIFTVDVKENNVPKQICEKPNSNKSERSGFILKGSNWIDENIMTLDECFSYHPSSPSSQSVIRLVNQNLAKNTKKILICAPSNAAVDEIMRRLVSDPRLNGGIYNKKGTLYTPNVIRIGPGYHKELKKWSLNERLSQLKSVGKMISIDHFSRKLIQESSIICCTLSIAGSRILTPFIGAIDTVIVDEASQCVEASNLIPLKLDPKRVILVGDPKQLPATVFSVVALSLNYDRSLFQRLQELNFKTVLLQTQYRMHPRISAFPNNKFYKGQLKDAHDLVNSLKPLIDYYKLPLFAPLVFINISGVETKSTNSYINVLEVIESSEPA